MSDGVAITAGSGTTIATDDTGASGHVQLNKLAISTDGSATLIPADAANGLDVDVTRLPALAAGTNNIGDVDVLTVPAPLSTTGNGTAATALRVSVASDSTGQVVLAAGSAAIGKLAANSGVDIGDVDVTTLPVVNPIVRISQTPTVSTSPAYTAKDSVGGLLTFANAARVSAGGGIVQAVTVVDLSQQRPSLELVLFNQTFTASSDNAVFNPSDGDLANVVGVVAINSWSDFSTNSVATVAAVNLPFVLTGTSLFGQLVTRGTPTFVGTSDIIVILHIVQA